jgi:hypothetical protein
LSEEVEVTAVVNEVGEGLIGGFGKEQEIGMADEDSGVEWFLEDVGGEQDWA